mgnify:CR=1 FL=1
MAPDLLHLDVGGQQVVQRARGVHATILEECLASVFSEGRTLPAAFGAILGE